MSDDGRTTPASDLDLLVRSVAVLERTLGDPDALATALTDLLAETFADFSLVVVFDSAADLAGTARSLAVRHRLGERHAVLETTLGQSDPGDLHDLALVLLQGVDVAGGLRREAAAAGGVRHSRYVRSAGPYAERYGVQDVMIRAVADSAGEPAALLLAARDAGSGSFDAGDQRSFSVLADQVGLAIEATAAEARTRSIAQRRRAEAERQRRLLREIVATTSGSRVRIAAVIHDDLIQRLAAAMIRLDSLPRPVPPTIASQRDRAAGLLRLVTERLRQMLGELSGQDRLPRDLADHLREVLHTREPGAAIEVRGHCRDMPMEVVRAVTETLSDLVSDASDSTAPAVVELDEGPQHWTVVLHGAVALASLSDLTLAHLDVLDLRPSIDDLGGAITLRVSRVAGDGSGPGTDDNDLELIRGVGDEPVVAAPALPSPGSVDLDAAAVNRLGQELRARPFGWQASAEFVSAAVAGATGGWSAVVLTPTEARLPAVLAVHHPRPDRAALLEVTLGASSPTELLALLGSGERGSADVLDRLPEVVPAFDAYARAHAVASVVATPAWRDDVPAVLVVHGRDADAGPGAREEGPWVATLAAQVGLVTRLAAAEVEGERLRASWTRIAARRRSLLPTLSFVDDLERRRAADRLDTVAVPEVDAVVDLVTRMRADQPTGPVAEALETIAHVLAEARVNLKALSDELVPAEPVELLHTAAERMARELFEGVTGAPGHLVQGRREDVLDPSVHREVIRALREALSNARRHAEAGLVEVLVGGDANRLVVRVRDDGRGLRAAGTDRRRGEGYGLTSMTVRMRSIGGRAEVGPGPGGGTVVTLEVPLGTSH